MGSQTKIKLIDYDIELKPLTVIIGKNPVELSLLLRRLWASVGADDADYLPAGCACTADAYDRLKLTKSAELLLRDVGIELHVAPTAYVRTWSGESFELARAPPNVREVIAAVSALSSDDFRFVFIEEPEAHLHPSAQRLMARVIAEAVNRGKFVTITTNSDYLVGELNILIALSSAPEDVRRRLGYRDAEVLKPELVAAYLVKAEDSRTVIERLEVDCDIPEDEFARAAEEILKIRNELY